MEAPISNAQSGCGLLMTEFTSADGLSRMRETKRRRYLTFYDDEHPIGAQTFRIECGDAGRCGAHCRGDRLRHGRPEPGLPGQARGWLQRRLGAAARPAEDWRDLSRGAQVGNDSLHREVPDGLEREADCLRGTGAHGRGRRTERRGTACAHARTGLQRTGAVAVDRCDQAGGRRFR